MRFGSFFYVRPYLTGVTDANGTLRRKENGIDATVVAGPDFALTLDDFSLHFTGKDTQPKIDLVKYHGGGNMQWRLDASGSDSFPFLVYQKVKVVAKNHIESVVAIMI